MGSTLLLKNPNFYHLSMNELFWSLQRFGIGVQCFSFGIGVQRFGIGVQRFSFEIGVQRFSFEDRSGLQKRQWHIYCLEK
jgi:hypothetical protein